ncbi:MAG: hypothetical protein WC087_02665 [Candidatus Paceibacterota bacterium]
MIKKILYVIGGFIVFIIILLIIVPTPDIEDRPVKKKEVVVEQKVEKKKDVKKEEVKEEIKNDSCINIPDQSITRLESGLNTAGVTIRGVQAVKSEERPEFYFIAGDLEGPGLGSKSEIVIFATSDIEIGGFISVNAIALEFTEWADGPKSAFKFSSSEKEAIKVRECTEEILK